MKKPLILVTGSEGQLGSEIRRASKVFDDLQFLFISKKDTKIKPTFGIQMPYWAESLEKTIN